MTLTIGRPNIILWRSGRVEARALNCNRQDEGTVQCVRKRVGNKQQREQVVVNQQWQQQQKPTTTRPYTIARWSRESFAWQFFVVFVAVGSVSVSVVALVATAGSVLLYCYGSGICLRAVVVARLCFASRPPWHSHSDCGET